MGGGKNVKVKKFVNKTAANRYQEYTQGRRLTLERGFLLSDTPTMGQPAFVTEVIRTHGWRRFCQHPSNPIGSLVREFYANLLDYNQETVFVRNVQVPFTTQAINSIFGLEEVVDEHTDFATEVTEEQLEVVLATVAVDGAAWSISPQGAYTCIRKELKPEAQIWYHFLTARLMPSTHGKTVAKDRVLLLYSILTGMPINIGEIIIEEIKACSAAKKKGGLYFPSLITQLCLRANVPCHEDDALEVNAGAISALSMSRISQGRPVRGERAGFARVGASSSAQGTAEAANGIVPPELAQSLRMLEQRMSLQEIQQYEIQGLLGHIEAQQRQYWEYVKKRDLAVKKSYQRNFTRPTEPIPVFPDALLQPWQPTEEQPSYGNATEVPAGRDSQPTAPHDAAAEVGEDIHATQAQDAAAAAPTPEVRQQPTVSPPKKKGKAAAHDPTPRRLSLRSASNWKWKA